MTLESRHLGPIELQGGLGGGTMDAVIRLADDEVPLRLEIDFPQRLDDLVVSKIDIALDNLGRLDAMARDTILESLTGHGPAARLLQSWKASIQLGSDDSVEAFARALRPQKATLLPDGGRGSLDRIVLVYGIGDTRVAETVTVRFQEGLGPRLDATARG